MIWIAIFVVLCGILVGGAWPHAWSGLGPARVRAIASAALVGVGLLGLGACTYAYDGDRAAARCATTTTLVDYLSEAGRPSGAATEEVCRRLRAGTLAPAELVDVVRSLWTLRLGVDPIIDAGQTMNVCVALSPPALEGIPEPFGPRAPRLRWRLVDVRFGDSSTASTARAIDGPLPLVETSAWQSVDFAASLPPGTVAVRCRVDFELRAADASTTTTRWSQWLEQPVQVVVVAMPAEVARVDGAR